MSVPLPVALPPPPFPLDGFPRCAFTGPTGIECRSEVLKIGDICGSHPGGTPVLDFGVLRRSIVRQIRTGVLFMQNCRYCASLGRALDEVRCGACGYMRGCILGIAGIAEEHGWAEDSRPLLDLVARREEVPGTAIEATFRGALGPHGKKAP